MPESRPLKKIPGENLGDFQASSGIALNLLLILLPLRKSKAAFNRFCSDTLMLEYAVALWLIASIPRG